MSRASSSGSSSNAAARQSASARETVSAADDDSPLPDRHRRRHDRVDPDVTPPTLVEQRYHGGDVTAPAGRVAAAVGADLDRVSERERADTDEPITRLPRDGGAEVDRDGQHQPARVVGVLPDQIDAGGSEDGAAGHAS